MRDRHMLETVLIRRFPGAGRDQIAAAANAIMALIDQWATDDHSEHPLAASGGESPREDRHERTYGH